MDDDRPYVRHKYERERKPWSPWIIGIMIAIVILAAFLVGAANAQEMSRAPDELTDGCKEYASQLGRSLRPGDKCYKHTNARHEKYKEVFAKMKCQCHNGECRATVMKSATPSTENPLGVLLKIEGKWCPLRKGVPVLQENIPPELRQDEAHLCAEKGTTDPCSRLNCSVITLMF